MLTELTLEVMDIGRDAVTVHPKSHEKGPFDRFHVKLVAKELGLGRFTAWKLKPALLSESQAVEGEIVEVWLPRPSGASFEKARDMELAEEIGPIQAIIDNEMKNNKNISFKTYGFWKKIQRSGEQKTIFLNQK